MRILGVLFFLSVSLVGKTQITDSLLLGNWELTRIIDNLTGEEITPPKKRADQSFVISFYTDSLVKFNLEINKCSNSYVLPQKNQIKFLFYAECTKICCDNEFSELLMYEDCTSYYIKDKSVLLLVSEDRVYYFDRRE